MTRSILRTLTSGVVVVVLFAAAPRANAATRYVADIGNDGPSCGISLATACRSITQAVELANPGDTILVGPGRYGDLNRNGILGEPGEELGYLTPPASCSCVLRIEKRVIIISSGGAAVTMIDGRSVDVIQNVFLTTVGGEFGRPGKGFTVTGTKVRNGHGIVLDAGDVWTVRGHQVIYTANSSGDSTGKGIFTVNNAAVRIEGNQVTGWHIGIEGRGAATVSKNQVWRNAEGIVATGGSVVGNVATDNGNAIFVYGSAKVTSNAIYANSGVGIFVLSPFSGVITKNNMFGNGSPVENCGLWNHDIAGLVATNNYWGAATGPGPAPADRECNVATDVTPFATKPFTVKPLKP